MRKTALSFALIAILAMPAFAVNRRVDDGLPITDGGDQSVISRFVRVITHVFEVAPEVLPIIPHP